MNLGKIIVWIAGTLLILIGIANALSGALEATSGDTFTAIVSSTIAVGLVACGLWIIQLTRQ
jgi:hypothetical protein